MHSDGLANGECANSDRWRRDAMQRTVIVFYWRRVVLAHPARVSLATPTSRAAIPATSASEAVRRVACRKWSHRCRVLINQISTTITAIMWHSDLFQRTVCLWVTLHSQLISQLDLSQSQSLFRGLRKSSNSTHKFSLIVRVRLALEILIIIDVLRRGREELGDILFSLVAPCVILHYNGYFFFRFFFM